MKALLKTKEGETKQEIKLPKVFEEPVRLDLIKRAVLALQSHRRQPYGTDPEAGKKYSSKLSRRRRDYKTAYGIGISRVPRKILSYRGSRFNWVAAETPNTVGGREAHPPKAEKIWIRKINKKEKRKALYSALSASVKKEYVEKRGHIVSDYPLVLEDDVESIKKTKEVILLLKKIGLEKELIRCSKKKLRTGNARRRGRAVKYKIGPLIVVSKKCELINACQNIPGVNSVEVQSLNVEHLAPGTHPGRLTLFTKSALEFFEEKKDTTSKKEDKKEMKDKNENKSKKSRKKK